MPRHHTKSKSPVAPQPGWAIYLRTSSDENQKPELSRARQRFVIEKNVLERSEIAVFDEYVDVLSGKTPERAAYQRLLGDARLGKFSHVVVERADVVESALAMDLPDLADALIHAMGKASGCSKTITFDERFARQAGVFAPV